MCSQSTPVNFATVVATQPINQPTAHASDCTRYYFTTGHCAARIRTSAPENAIVSVSLGSGKRSDRHNLHNLLATSLLRHHGIVVFTKHYEIDA